MTGNPTLNQNTFTSAQQAGGAGAMTIQGTVDKTSILLVLLTLAAAFTWHTYYAGQGAPDQGAQMMPWMLGGLIGGR